MEQKKTEKLSYEYRLIRSKRKTLSLEVKRDGSIIVRAPLRVSQKRIHDFLQEKEAWLSKILQKIEKTEKEKEQIQKLSEEQREQLIQEAKIIFEKRSRYYADRIKVNFGRITIREQKTRWGSCSSKGNLNFNWKLVLAPPEILDYVVVHELCHRMEMNHSKAFWAHVERILPDYEKRRKWLKENGWKLMEA